MPQIKKNPKKINPFTFEAPFLDLLPALFRGTKFSCQNLKYLSLSFHQGIGDALVSHTLENFPELMECHPRYVTFLSRETNGCVSPFSQCKNMTTLSIDCCTPDIGKCVVNGTLTRLSIRHKLIDDCPFKVQMSTANLSWDVKCLIFLGFFFSAHSVVH